MLKPMSYEPLRITWLSVSWTNELPELARMTS